MIGFDPAEIERRRQASIAEMKRRDEAAWQAKYQETCDAAYWRLGQCCAGCDHWESESGLTGRCTGAGIVSGDQVMRSMGVAFSSYTPAPGFPVSAHDFRCGLFRDDFDWSTLDADYLHRIGAMRGGKLRDKPRRHPA